MAPRGGGEETLGSLGINISGRKEDDATRRESRTVGSRGIRVIRDGIQYSGTETGNSRVGG